MFRTVLRTVVIAAPLLALARSSLAENMQDVPLATLLAGIEANYSRVDSVTCRFEMRTRHTEAGRQLGRTLRRPGVVATRPPTERVEYVHWRAKPHEGLFRYDIEVREERTNELLEKRLVTFDGSRGVTYSSRGAGSEKTIATIGSEPPGALSLTHTAPSALIGGLVYLYNLPLHRVLAEAESLTDAGKVRIGDVECRRLEAEGCINSAQSRNRFRVDVDPLADFSIRQIDVHYEKSGRTFRNKTVSVTRHQLPTGEGLLFPTVITSEFWDRRYDEPVNVTQVEVKEVSFADAHALRDFQFEFPSGTVVRDEDKGVNFVVGDADDEAAGRTAEQAIEELRKKQGAPDRATPPSFSTLPSIAAAIVALGVGALVLWLRRR
jgi:hypothetical protein